MAVTSHANVSSQSETRLSVINVPGEIVEAIRHESDHGTATVKSFCVNCPYRLVTFQRTGLCLQMRDVPIGEIGPRLHLSGYSIGSDYTGCAQPSFSDKPARDFV